MLRKIHELMRWKYENTLPYRHNAPILYWWLPVWWHITHQHISSQTGYMNITMRSVYFSSLPSHQNWSKQSTFGMWQKRGFAPWLCSWQICINYVIESRWHELEFPIVVTMPFWEQNGVWGGGGSTQYQYVFSKIFQILCIGYNL